MFFKNLYQLKRINYCTTIDHEELRSTSLMDRLFQRLSQFFFDHGAV